MGRSGLLSTARQLHAAAKVVVQEHGGQFPADVDALQSLPGVGRYTAGAVASIAFDLPAPIVEANTQRVYARLLKQERPAPELLWQFAQWQLPAHGSRLVNQAAMELGSLVCKPVDPMCLVCPVVALCPTAAAGLQHAIPAPKPKQQFTSLHHVALIIRQDNRWLVRQNPPGAWWHGLWDFPRFDVTCLQLAQSQTKSQPLAFSAAQLRQIAQLANENLFGANNSHDRALLPGEIQSLQSPVVSMKHGVTRFRIRLDCLPAEASLGAGKLPSDWRWADRSTLQGMPLTSTAQKLLTKLCAA